MGGAQWLSEADDRAHSVFEREKFIREGYKFMVGGGLSVNQQPPELCKRLLDKRRYPVDHVIYGRGRRHPAQSGESSQGADAQRIQRVKSGCRLRIQPSTALHCLARAHRHGKFLDDEGAESTTTPECSSEERKSEQPRSWQYPARGEFVGSGGSAAIGDVEKARRVPDESVMFAEQTQRKGSVV